MFNRFFDISGCNGLSDLICNSFACVVVRNMKLTAVQQCKTQYNNKKSTNFYRRFGKIFKEINKPVIHYNVPRVVFC